MPSNAYEQQDCELREELLTEAEDLQRQMRAPQQKVASEVISETQKLVKPLDDNADVLMYLRNCREYQVPVDPSVVISLKTEWSIMQPTKAFCEGSMLPLAGVLENNKHIKKLKMRGAGMSHRYPAHGNGNSNARILSSILAQNNTVESVDLSNTGLDADGMREICTALRHNRSITHLNLSRNRFGEDGAALLSDALDKAQKLTFLDVRSNALGFSSISKIEHRCKNRPSRCCHLHVETEGNFVFEEVLNSMTHGIGFLFSIAGAILLMAEACKPGKSHEHFWGCLVFSISLMFLYLASTLFHSFFMLPYVSSLFKIADHCAIYILIAGSYTPFMLISMNGSTYARAVIISEWVAAISGCVFSVTCSSIKLKATMYIELSIYLALGLAVVLVWDHVKLYMPFGELMLVAGGGVAYVGGVIFFILGEKMPVFHTVWHVFVMMASTLHWFAVYRYAVHAPVPGVLIS